MREKFCGVRVPNSNVVGSVCELARNLFVVRVLISPKLAKEWLELIGRNRKVIDNNVIRIARTLGKDHWRFNGATIVFDRLGNLLDGQHRLLGCVRAGKPLISLVVIGIEPEETLESMDLGSKRTAANALEIHGKGNSSLLAAACRLMWAHLMFDVSHDLKGAENPSPADVIQLLEEYPEIEDSCVFISKHRPPPGLLPPSVAGLFHYLMSRVDLDMADEFWRDFSTGADLPPGNPVLALRNKLFVGVKDRKKFEKSDQIIFTEVAVNAYMENRKLNVVRHSEKVRMRWLPSEYQGQREMGGNGRG